MADKSVCKIEGCGKPAKVRGLCSGHYYRLRRRGTTEAAQTPKGEPARFLRDVVFNSAQDECLTWPYNRHDHGYGMIWLDGKPARVCRVVCAHFHGDPPEGAHAAHSCGNPICCNPRHIRWASASENQMDRVQHGTHQRGERHPNCSLSEDDVRRIRVLSRTMLHRDIAEMFGIHRMTVGKIARRKAWAWLED